MYHQMSMTEIYPNIFSTKSFKKTVDISPQIKDDKSEHRNREFWSLKIAVHDALKLIASEDDDGAQERNGVGFNKFDTNFGRQLASQHSLSFNQTIAAIKMLKKYKKQLPKEMFEYIYQQEKGGD